MISETNIIDLISVNIEIKSKPVQIVKIVLCGLGFILCID